MLPSQIREGREGEKARRQDSQMMEEASAQHTRYITCMCALRVKVLSWSWSWSQSDESTAGGQDMAEFE